MAKHGLEGGGFCLAQSLGLALQTAAARPKARAVGKRSSLASRSWRVAPPTAGRPPANRRTALLLRQGFAQSSAGPGAPPRGGVRPVEQPGRTASRLGAPASPGAGGGEGDWPSAGQGQGAAQAAKQGRLHRKRAAGLTPPRPARAVRCCPPAAELQLLDCALPGPGVWPRGQPPATASLVRTEAARASQRLVQPSRDVGNLGLNQDAGGGSTTTSPLSSPLRRGRVGRGKC